MAVLSWASSDFKRARSSRTAASVLPPAASGSAPCAPPASARGGDGMKPAAAPLYGVLHGESGAGGRGWGGGAERKQLLASMEAATAGGWSGRRVRTG